MTASYEYEGRSMTLTEWSAEIGVPRQTLFNRLRLGWSIEKALTTPRGGPLRKPIRHETHLEIPLTHGYSAIVDLDCPDWILKKTWSAKKWKRRTTYAVCRHNRRITYLHRVIMGLEPGSAEQVDHIDNDGLNNLKSNLRQCSNRQNQANKGSLRGSSSQFRGVKFQHNGWTATLAWRDKGKRRDKYLGRFKTEEDAARAWDKAAIASGLYDPEFLRLNFPN